MSRVHKMEQMVNVIILLLILKMKITMKNGFLVIMVLHILLSIQYTKMESLSYSGDLGVFQ